MTMSYTFLAAVRLKDGERMKLHVERVPSASTARAVIERELRAAGTPPMAIIVRTDGVPTDEYENANAGAGASREVAA